jgi:lysophosphatidate acyltransferase
VYFSNTVFINRANHSSAIAAFDSAAQYMTSEKQSVFIFPEGTRSYYSKPDLLPFKKGAFHLAVKAQVPIVPVVCANYSSILSFKYLYFHAGRIPIRVLKPVETKGLTSADVEDLMKFVREEMLKALRELQAKPALENGVAVKQESASQRTKVAVAATS